MKLVHNNETQEFKNSEVCTAYEYPLGDKDINGAVIKLSGRYPQTGQVRNNVCKEMAYIINGLGKVVVESEERPLHRGDVLLIYPGEKYYFEGHLDMFMPCTPAWYPEQHEAVE